MEKRQSMSTIACLFLFLSLACQIQCLSQTQLNGIRRNGPSLRSTKIQVNQEKLKREDLIKKLPGQPDAKFKQYGGYVAVNETAGQFLYYYFVESVNVSCPLVIWFNGGPGCSSLTAAFTSHGPFRIHSDGKTLYQNPYSWNNEANMLYVESPIEVGFSYTNTPSTEPNSHGDTLTAEGNYMFLVKWLERFPEYKGREFYIAAQSYGGHYGPQLAQIILQRKNQTPFINLRGMILGNPAFEVQILDKGNNEYLANHAIVPKELLAKRNKICGPSSGQVEVFSECGKVDKEVASNTNGLNLYSIYAPMCLNSTLTSKPKKHATVTQIEPCSTYYMEAYLNMENVQESMHANTTKLPYPWSQCKDDINAYWNETERFASTLPILQELIKDIRIVVYAGDWDAVVSVTSSMQVVESLNLTVEKIWRPWFSEREVGGYTQEYKGNFTFATVRGAGHDVPSDQPIRALTLFTSFIRNIPLPQL